MVPGSTLMYGSSFMIVIFRPRFSRSAPIEADARPLPMEETTPPVTKMNLVCLPGIGPNLLRCRTKVNAIGYSESLRRLLLVVVVVAVMFPRGATAQSSLRWDPGLVLARSDAAGP